MKPLGITASFQIVRASAAEDAIWRVVEECIDAGVSPDAFRREAAQAWEHFLTEKAKEAKEILLRRP